MKRFWNTPRILMVFLLLLFVLPDGMKAQENKISNNSQNDSKSAAETEKSLLMNEVPEYSFDNSNEATGNLPEHFVMNTEASSFIQDEKHKLATDGNGNYIELDMYGQNNQVDATQIGSGNVMDLGVRGQNIDATYQQQGDDNYIYDRVAAEGEVSIAEFKGMNSGQSFQREIYQQGQNLGIYNQGQQATPMIIKQRGQGMKIKIEGSPLY
mgnify:FL=1